MAIYKRGGVYWFHFVYDGRHIQRSTKQSNRRVAREIEAAYRTKLAKGEVGINEPKPIPTFGNALREFLEIVQQHRPNRERSSYRRYQTSSKALKRYFKDRLLDEITVEDVEKFKLKRWHEVSPRTKRVIRPATVNRELACLKALFNYAIKNDVVMKNPVSRIKFLAEDNEQMRVLTYDEERLYLLAASQPLRDVAILMLETGMRPEEVCRMSKENVHLQQGYYFNPYGKTKAAKRKVPLSDKACEVIYKRLAAREGVYLFPGGRGGNDVDNPIVKVNGAHNSARKRSGVRQFRLYDLRHTWATRAAMAGIDLVTLAAMLGHSRIQMVLRYAHPTEEHQFQAMRKVEAFKKLG